MRRFFKKDASSSSASFRHVHVHHAAEHDDAAARAELVEEGLQAIYGETRDDLARVTREPFRLTGFLVRLIVFLFMLLVLSGGGLFAYFFFSQEQDVDALRVVLSVPEEVVSGEPVSFILAYENTQKNPLTGVTFDVNLPSGFVFTDASLPPLDASQLVWNVGSLGRFSDGKLEISGVWYGDVSEEQNRIQVITSYRPVNVSAEFSFVSTQEFSVSSSALALTLTGPEGLFAGEEGEYVATLTHTGTLPLTGHVSFVLPQGFSPTLWDPELPPGEGTTLSFVDLAPGALLEQKMHGAFLGDVDGVQDIRAVVSLDGDDASYTQQDVSWLTRVTGSDVLVTLLGNGVSSDVPPLVLGDNLRVSVQIAYNGEEPLADASLLLDFQPEQGVPLVWSKANVGKARITQKGILLEGDALVLPLPHEEKIYSFIFPVQSALTEQMLSEFFATAYLTVGDAVVQSLPLQFTVAAP